ncbi:MAG: xanthine dehydrogenase family protein subunit M [Chloroflexi bacterium]|nr:xanthine dehydrogenase family protein subunit M [Chloroflexota bacterium]
MHEPETVAEAVSLLGQHGADASLYAGGTELLLAMKEGLLRYGHLVNLKTVPGLDRLDYDTSAGELHIGPAVTHRTLELSPEVAARFPLISDAESKVANVRVRNVGTLCGNLCFAEPHSDPAAFLLLYDSRVEVQGAGGSRTIPLDQLVLGPYETCLEEGEMLTSVSVPQFGPEMKAAYQKFGYHQRPTLGLGVAVRLENGSVAEARIAVGSVGPKPVRVPEAEELFLGKTVGDILGPASGPRLSVLDEAGRMAAQAAEPMDDLHGAADYKEHLVRIFLGRVFAEAVGAAPAAQRSAA